MFLHKDYQSTQTQSVDHTLVVVGQGFPLEYKSGLRQRHFSRNGECFKVNIQNHSLI